MPLYVLAKSAINVRLITSAMMCMHLEPCHNICVQTQRYLLLYGPVEHAAPGVRPIKYLRDVGGVDLVFG